MYRKDIPPHKGKINVERWLIQKMFRFGPPKYEFKATKRIGHCSLCGHRFYKKEVRLRVMIAEFENPLLCATGLCCEWFFRILLQFKEGV